MTTGNGSDKPASVDVALGIHDGKIVMTWRTPTSIITFDPENAFQLAEAIARSAHEAKFGKVVQTDKSYLAQQIKYRVTDEIRGRMVLEAGFSLKKMLEQDRGPDYIAKEIVDRILSEVA